MCVVGGLIGLTLGAAVAGGLGAVMGWPIYISPMVVVIAIAASATVGIVFGFVPARRASQLNPIDALRYE